MEIIMHVKLGNSANFVSTYFFVNKYFVIFFYANLALAIINITTMEFIQLNAVVRPLCSYIGFGDSFLRLQISISSKVKITGTQIGYKNAAQTARRLSQSALPHLKLQELITGRLFNIRDVLNTYIKSRVLCLFNLIIKKKN